VSRLLAVRGALVALTLALPVHALAAKAPGHPPPAELTLERLENRYALLLARHRPDLAERYGATPVSVTFEPIDEATAEAHVDELRQLLTEADTLSGGRARIHCATGSGAKSQRPARWALHRDALLWLDVVDAAARAPFALGSANGCDRTRRGAMQLRILPEALRGARCSCGRPTPDPAAFEARLAGLEQLSARPAGPDRTLQGSRRRAEFVEADSLAAASLAQFRRWLASATSARGMRKLAVRLNCWCSALTTGSLQR